MSPAGAAGSDSHRFQQLWQRSLREAAEDHSAEIHKKLIAAYCEPQRFYHDLSHIDHCLSMFDQASHLMQYPDTVELAVWMHDVVYQPGAPDNETRSVDWYRDVAGHDQHAATREIVCQLIMATMHDGNSMQLSDAAYMVDIDLSSFALPWDEFMQDGVNLRQENSHLADADYYRNQVRFQKSLLARERFYVSDYFHDNYEARARENLAHYFEYLAQLQLID